MARCECGVEAPDELLRIGPARCSCGRWFAWQCEKTPAEPTAWVLALRSRRAPEDKGVGDTFARLLGKGGELFKSWSAKLGIPCGCTARQREWNERWPY